MSEATHGEIDAWITPSADIIGHTSDGMEYEMGSLLNYTAIEAKYNIPGDKESQEILENLLLTPRKVFSGVKVLREGRAGFYNETSTYQKEKWTNTFENGFPSRRDAFSVSFPAGSDDNTIIAFKTKTENKHQIGREY